MDKVDVLLIHAPTNLGAMLQAWSNNFGVSLPSCALIGDGYCKKWLEEGKMRKLFNLWLNEKNEAVWEHKVIVLLAAIKKTLQKI